MNIRKKVEQVLSKSGKEIFTRKEIIELAHSHHGINKSSVIPSDYCYNRTNDGIDHNQIPEPKFLILINNGTYKYIGFNYPYSGLVYHQPKNRKIEAYIVGEWVEGKYQSLENIVSDLESISAKDNLSPTEKMVLINARIGQGTYRDDLIKIWKGSCAVTGYDEPSLLIASHIKPWRDSSNQERLDPYNGLLLQPNLDKAFDNGLISFDETGKILISPLLVDPRKLAISKDMSLSLLSDHKPYMLYHRENVFKPF